MFHSTYNENLLENSAQGKYCDHVLYILIAVCKHAATRKKERFLRGCFQLLKENSL